MPSNSNKYAQKNLGLDLKEILIISHNWPKNLFYSYGLFFQNLLSYKLFFSEKHGTKFHYTFFSAGDICPCLVLPESFKSALAQMLDVSLLKDPVFMLIGISNFFGMAGLYVPFFYLVDCAKKDVSIYYFCIR